MDSRPRDGSAAGPTKRALLIGINRYQYVRSLNGCANDIRAIYDFLTNRGDFHPAQVQVLLAASSDGPLPSGEDARLLPTRARILAGLQTLAAQTRAGDEVVVYYSGHGASISNPADPRERIGAIVPCDAHAATGANFILNRDLNEAIGALTVQRAAVTVILDSCHSGGATRGFAEAGPGRQAVREVVVGQIRPEAWAALTRGSPAPARGVARRGNENPLGGGWSLVRGGQDDLIVVSACRAAEAAQEQPFPGPHGPVHGALTYCLLDALRRVGAAADGLARATWQEVYPQVAAGVQTFCPAQTPTLEGAPERRVFGGAWRAYAPGFTVSPGPGGVLVLDGGSVHGLDAGAAVAIYPPATADFREADSSGVRAVPGVVVGTATPVQSTVQVAAGQEVPAGSRARLTRPSPHVALLGVALAEDLPAGVRETLLGVPDAARYVTLEPVGAPDVEIRPAAGIAPAPSGPGIGPAPDPPPAAGWVLVPYTNAEPSLTWNDVIAWTPLWDRAAEPVGPPGESRAGRAARVLGTALGLGLIHWARYRAVLTRRNPDDRLRGALAMALEAATRPVPADPAQRAAHWDDPAAWRLLSAGEAMTPGVRALLGDPGDRDTPPPDMLRLRVSVASDAPALSVGLLLCSDDGNILLVWPPGGMQVDNVIRPGEEKRLGLVQYGGLMPFALTLDRPEQTVTRYTFKAFGTTGPLPVQLQSLQLRADVQDILDAWLRPSLRAVPVADALPVDLLWTTVALPVFARRGAGGDQGARGLAPW